MPVPPELRRASSAVRQRNPHVFGEPATEDPGNDRPADAYEGAEASLQMQAERYLVGRGYRHRRNRDIMDSSDRGWQLHLQRAPGNPYLLDLLIPDQSTGRYIEIELKTAKGKVSPHQRALIERGNKIAWNMDQLREIVEAWEREAP